MTGIIPLNVISCWMTGIIPPIPIVNCLYPSGIAEAVKDDDSETTFPNMKSQPSLNYCSKRAHLPNMSPTLPRGIILM